MRDYMLIPECDREGTMVSDIEGAKVSKYRRRKVSATVFANCLEGARCDSLM